MRTLTLALLLAGCMAGAPSVEPSSVPTVRPSVRPMEPRADRVIVDIGLGVRPMPSRPVVPVPSPRLRDVARSDGLPAGPVSHGSTPGGRVVSGVGSWYCGNGSPCTRGYPGGLYAAAGPRLRAAYPSGWRGRTVLVTAGGRSVRVTLIDWCACPGGRVLDLYSDAFRRLAPLSAGLVKVTVR